MLQLLDLVQNPSPSALAGDSGASLQDLLQGIENQQDVLPEGFAEALQGLLQALDASAPALPDGGEKDTQDLQAAAAISGNPLPPLPLQSFIENLSRSVGLASSGMVSALDGQDSGGAADSTRQALMALLQALRGQEAAQSGIDAAALKPVGSITEAPADDRPELAMLTLLQERKPGEVNRESAWSQSVDGVRQAMMLTDAPARHAASVLPQARPVSLPVQHPQWGDEFGQRVAWMIDHAIKSAEIHLDPPDLGPMRLHLRMEGDQVQLAIQAHHPQVRDALEQNLPRLREFLGAQGMNLVQVDISQHGFAGQQGQGQGTPAGGGEGMAMADSADTGEGAGARTSRVLHGQGMIDTYA